MSRPSSPGLLRHVVVIVAALSAVGAATGLTAAALAAPPGGVDVVESDSCTAGGDRWTAVATPLPPTALVHLDDDGGIRAAATNTGCAPRPTDRTYLVTPNGSIVPAPPGMFDGHRWHGDFRLPGATVEQTDG